MRCLHPSHSPTCKCVLLKLIKKKKKNTAAETNLGTVSARQRRISSAKIWYSRAGIKPSNDLTLPHESECGWRLMHALVSEN